MFFFPHKMTLSSLAFRPPGGTNFHHGDSIAYLFSNHPVLTKWLQNHPLGLFMTG
jgi:hypothetical protein